jgi:hypothetical protein
MSHSKNATLRCTQHCLRFLVLDQKTGWKEKMTLKTHAALHASRRAARHAARCRVSEIGRGFCCTSKTHVIAADGMCTVRCTSKLHIQNASVIDPLASNDLRIILHLIFTKLCLELTPKLLRAGSFAA